MRAMQAQIKALDQEIERQAANIPNTLTLIPGIGPTYSAGIIAEIDDINRFDSYPALAKYAGLAWTQHQSGLYQHKRALALTVRKLVGLVFRLLKDNRLYQSAG